jgi:flagellar motor switch protein FliN
MNESGKEPAAFSRVIEEVSLFADIPMTIRIQIASRSMTIREVLLLKKNSIVELPKSAGENIDIYINSTPVAFGEVLDLEGNAGIRLTDFAAS